MNPSLAPRRRGCLVCKAVVDLADVNLRLLDAAGDRHVGGVAETIGYLRGIGMVGSDGALKARVTSHRQHTEQFLRTHDAPPAIAPGEMGTVTRLGTRPDATWLSVQQAAMNVGHQALGILAERLASGDAETREVVSTARLGLTAAGKYADLELKGRVQRAHERMRIASGLSRDGSPG